MKFSKLRWLFLIVILVIASHAAFFFTLVPYNPEPRIRDHYLGIARNIVAGNGFTSGGSQPTTTRGPGAPYFFATILWIFGDHTLPIAFSNWMLQAVTAILLYLIALEIFGNKQIALVSSLLFAFYGPGIYYSWQALSEPLFTMLLAAFILSFLRALRLPSVGTFVMAGALLGLASLTRPTMLYFLPIAILVLGWCLYPQGKEIIKWGGILSASFIVVMIPWTIRNYLLFEQFIPVNTYSGITFYQGNYALGEPDFLRTRHYLEPMNHLRSQLQEKLGPAYEELDQREFESIAKEKAVEIIRQYPDRFVVLSGVRFFQLWYFIEGPRSVYTYLVLLMNGSLLVLAAIAFLYYRDGWKQQGVVLVSILFLYYMAGNSMVFASVRYTIPITPYVMLFAAVAIVNIWLRFRVYLKKFIVKGDQHLEISG